ncbi:FAD:protein FMN transferase [Streptococcus phocae subsp. salmonis]|uniref:FAD:protein FMN transferase n=1 Tax=Streptococcus phocae TaxID=119224 RepID=UPI0005316D67|nr:FAD:protein FMN transferase [Streptococcus phocae]KGR72811.1 thiamine biosynthesis protein ApbE [Streptococcus phocae subsp. salmonis]
MQLSHSLKLMGTTINIQINSKNAQKQILEVTKLLELYKNRFSANDFDSELMAINNNAGRKAVQVHPDLMELITIGKEHSLARSSNLNIAIGPLVQAWRIGFSDAKVPSSNEILEAIALSNPSQILLDSKYKSVFLKQTGMKIDLGALAKGYIADKIMSYLKKDLTDSAIINLGGNILVQGDNPNRSEGHWIIGIQHPKKKRGQHIGAVKIKNQSVVTSGTYERCLIVEGKEYHHIFDRQTGYPINTEMTSISIVSKKSVDCEIWTTRLFGLPIQEVLDTLNAVAHIEGIIITKDDCVYLSDGLKHHFQLFYH